MKLADATFAIIDTETTRKDPDDPELELVEVAVDLYHDLGCTLVDRFHALVRVQRPIPSEVSGIHHLTNEDVADANSREVIMESLWGFLRAHNAIPVAHHAAYDAKVLYEITAPWICSERLAHHLTPELADFKLGTLRYAYGFRDISFEGINAPPERWAHGAEGDIRVLAPVFFHLVARYRAWAEQVCNGDLERLEKAEQVETLITFAKRPYVMAKWPPFGKHGGDKFEDIPSDYFRWCFSDRGLTDMDDDLRYNIGREMARRGEAQQMGLLT